MLAMIIGIGNDLVEIARIRRIHHIYAQFNNRILTPKEVAHLWNAQIDVSSQRYTEFLAGRFAAKEAFAKAVGCGIGHQFSFQDLSILPNTKGVPQCYFSDRWKTGLRHLNQANVYLSISHTQSMAQAFVVIEGDDDPKA